MSKGDTTELIEPSPKITESENRDFLQTIGEIWSDVTNVVLCGSLPLGFQLENLSRLDLTGKRLFIDAIEGFDTWLESGVELLKINLSEYCKLLQRFGIPQITSSPQFWKMTASTLLERLPIGNLVVTDEDAPIHVFYMQEGKFMGLSVKPPAVKLVNDIGGRRVSRRMACRGLPGASHFGSPGESRCGLGCRCEVDRPWNIDLGRVSALESDILPLVEKIAD